MIYIGLDIDETIIKAVEYHGLSDRPDDAEFYFELFQPNYTEKFAVYKRNHLNEFIENINKNFKIFFYTRADRTYAEIILNNLNLAHYPLFARENTIKKEELIDPIKGTIITYYQKDLQIVADNLKIDKEDIIFIDDVVNEKELKQTNLAIEIPEFDIEIEDFDLKIIINHIESAFLKYENDSYFKDYIRSLNFY